MANLINAKTSGAGGLETTADNTGNINIQSGGSTVMEVTSAGVAVTGSLTQNGGAYSTQPTFRNRIINGNMTIDQRNAGASVTPADGSYTIDRWATIATAASKFSIQQNAGAVTPPAGFSNYLGITSLSAYSVGTGDILGIQQRIEGFNAANLNWGTADAKTVTLSFQVYSSLTGTFGGSLINSAVNRSYPFSYTVSSANTWTSISITIAGDTTGTWLTTSGNGIQVNFGIGGGSTYSGTAGAWVAQQKYTVTGATSVVGTSGATFYITGVQLETGTTATDFENLQYGQQLALCQRYYYKWNTVTSNNFLTYAMAANTTTLYGILYFPTTMRSNPSSVDYGSGWGWWLGGALTSISAVGIGENGNSTVNLTFTTTGVTAQKMYGVLPGNSSNYIGLSAEL